MKKSADYPHFLTELTGLKIKRTSPTGFTGLTGLNKIY